MNTHAQANEMLEGVAKVLLRCAILGMLFLLLWFGVYLLAAKVVAQQGQWFDLTPHEIGVIHYCGMLALKMCVFLGFIMPYIAIRLVLWQGRKSLA